jgi:hypothetical protein
MTTIDEESMDEFFNFEDAAPPSEDVDFSISPATFDIDLDLQSGDSFFPDPDLNLNLKHAFHADTTQMGPDDFTDFPRWIDGMVVPTQSCAYCKRMRIHCKVLKEGLRRGSCTSCVALARSCSLTHASDQRVEDIARKNSESCGQPGTYGLAGNIGLPGEDLSEMGGAEMPQVTECCDGCRRKNLWCEVVKAGGRAGDCVPCTTASEPCSLTAHKYQGECRTKSSTPTKSSMEEVLGFSNTTSRTSSVENINAMGNSKIGARFSRESNRILRSWLSTHHQNPYPSDEEKDSLMRQTGLNKTQITNWLANARRRGKVRPPRSTSPGMSNYTNAMDIPRRATPALEHMNPLERWKNSPPENEPASVTAIAKAVSSSTFSSGRASPHTSFDDGSNRSLCNVSSTSSLGTSHSSGGSFASAFSHKSHKSQGSFGSFNSFGTRGRRRRRRAAPKQVNTDPMKSAAKTYQCTFCTETFKTKHDWQRHEKSLHLSLERWICCPDGPTQFCADYNHNRCVFCGLPNPPADHAEVHNYSSCADRALEERTFYRKDHLRQHLNLVHDVKFQSLSMDTWQVTTPSIRSRCGFCGLVLDSWSIRVDHLAEHFKCGKSMADWKGDWGFEPNVLDIVENGMPPCKSPHSELESADTDTR